MGPVLPIARRRTLPEPTALAHHGLMAASMRMRAAAAAAVALVSAVRARTGRCALRWRVIQQLRVQRCWGSEHGRNMREKGEHWALPNKKEKKRRNAVGHGMPTDARLTRKRRQCRHDAVMLASRNVHDLDVGTVWTQARM